MFPCSIYPCCVLFQLNDFFTLRSLPEDSKCSITETTQDEMNNFYKTISGAETKPAKLLVIPGYNISYVAKETMHSAST